MIKKYIPKFIAKGNVFKQIFESQQYEIDILNNNIQDIINNLFVETATWSLSIFEKEYGLDTVLSDALENRRSRILAKKRSKGVCNISKIKEIASSFSNGEVDVIPHYEDDYFTVTFIGTKGIPPRLEDLYDAIEVIKPAHLDIEYQFNYETWGEVKEYTWEELAHFTWEQVLNGDISHVDVMEDYDYLVNEDGEYLCNEDGIRFVVLKSDSMYWEQNNE